MKKWFIILELISSIHNHSYMYRRPFIFNFIREQCSHSLTSVPTWTLMALSSLFPLKKLLPTSNLLLSPRLLYISNFFSNSLLSYNKELTFVDWALRLWPLTSRAVGGNVGVLAFSGYCAVSPIVSHCCCRELFYPHEKLNRWRLVKVRAEAATYRSSPRRDKDRLNPFCDACSSLSTY